MYRLGHYVICLGAVAHIPVMNNNIMTLGYICAKLVTNKPPDIFCKIARIGRIISWIPSMLAWTLAL